MIFVVLLIVKSHDRHAFSSFLLTWNVTAQMENFAHFGHGATLHRLSLCYLSALSLARQEKKFSLYSRCWQSLGFSTVKWVPLVFLSALTKTSHPFVFFFSLIGSVLVMVGEMQPAEFCSCQSGCRYLGGWPSV